MKATKEFRAVPPGEVYPVTIAEGEDIPEELMPAARAMGAAEKVAKKATKAPENK